MGGIEEQADQSGSHKALDLLLFGKSQFFARIDDCRGNDTGCAACRHADDLSVGVAVFHDTQGVETAIVGDAKGEQASLRKRPGIAIGFGRSYAPEIGDSGEASLNCADADIV